MNIKLLAALGLCAVMAGAGAVSMEPVADQRMIKAHLGFLADDLLEGRETGSRGYDIAAHYVASQFTQYGVAPRGDKGGYLQVVPLRAGRLVQESPVVEISSKAGSEKLVYLDEFAMRGSLLEDASEVRAPLVFVGYGIEAARFKHDDYANVDVKGKIVVVLNGKPSSMPTEEGAHFSSADHKRSVAVQHGAVGMVVLQTPLGEKTQPFAKARQYRFTPAMGWLDAAGQPAHDFPTLQNGATLSLSASQKLFTQVAVKLDDIYADAAANKPLPHLDLNMTMRMSKNSLREDIKSSNVVGMIEGSDPVLKNEYVVFSAHLDHLGIAKEKSGDNIFNGAMDNASGVATMIETARLFSQLPVKPKRSILFVAVTGEEKGLLGADYFANNPTVPVTAIVADVNLDMPLLTYDFKNLVAFGAQHSSLKGLASSALDKMGLALIADPWPEQGLFTRSDHYTFVKQGIPSVFLVTGMGSFNKNEKPADIWAGFLHDNYHQVSDDLRQPINWNAAARFAQANFRIGLEIANAKKRPSWNGGDFFGDTFSKRK